MNNKQVTIPKPTSKIVKDKYGVLLEINFFNRNNFFHDDCTMRFRRIYSGMYKVGSPNNEAGRREGYYWIPGSDEDQRLVEISKGVWISETPCTQEIWSAVMGTIPSHYVGLNFPVEQINWMEVQDFCTTLNQRVPGFSFCLPTEREWEIGARAGTKTPYNTGEKITHEHVNFGAAIGHPKVAMSYPPNKWGLFDCHGGLEEWCEDVFGIDCMRVARGGSYGSKARDCRSAFREGYDRYCRSKKIGFRLACSGPDLVSMRCSPQRRSN